MSPGTVQSVLVYARISQDRRGERLGVERQIEACRQLCESRGYRVVDTYIDNDISASSGRSRPQFERLLEDTKSTDGIVTCALDRVLRTNADAQRVLDIRKPVYTVQQGSIDLSTSIGRIRLSLLASYAHEETEQKRQRLRAQRAQAAAEGHRHSGNRVVYGFNAYGTAHAEQAEVIQQVVRAVLYNEQSFRSQVRWLNDNGHKAPGGGLWTLSQLRQVLCAARLSGQREHQPGREENPPRGKFASIVGPSAEFEAIITPDEATQLRCLYESRTRTRAVRKHIFGGLVKCGRVMEDGRVCGANLMYRTDQGGRWICARVEDKSRCGRLSIMASTVNEVVEDTAAYLLLAPTHLDDEEFRVREQGREESRLTTMEELDVRRTRVTERFVEGVISEEAYENALNRLAELSDEIVQSWSAHPCGRFIHYKLGLLAVADTADEAWAQADEDVKRALLSAAVEQFKVKPMVSRKAVPTERIQVIYNTRTWRWTLRGFRALCMPAR